MQIEELKRLHEAATPGPWRIEQRKYENCIMQDFKRADGYNNRVACTVQWSPAPAPQPTPDIAKANAALIVALRNEAIPAIEHLTTELAALRASLQATAEAAATHLKRAMASEEREAKMREQGRKEAAMLREIAKSEARGIDWRVNLDATADFLAALGTGDEG